MRSYTVYELIAEIEGSNQKAGNAISDMENLVILIFLSSIRLVPFVHLIIQIVTAFTGCNRRVHALECIKGNQGKMERNSKVLWKFKTMKIIHDMQFWVF